MVSFLKRVGTAYIPVRNVELSSKWYRDKLGAIENFRNDEKAILEFANQSFFLVKSQEGQRTQFLDYYGNDHFTLTFEVDGLNNLKKFHEYLKKKEVSVGDIEDRGHSGNNFVFYDLNGNTFDVWSELSPQY
ncbi:VOC family protein [Pontibacillus yanchengensis]|uniref:VOC family protein n=1 Tax=Pontibacillus yanchengensis TaxID=462910 RepID=UPI00056AE73B|nr:VOC family protein [Pontibacillus yanchengensis]